MTDQPTWQEILDPPFVARLLRPWQRPGRIDPRMVNAIFARYQRPMTPLPLAEQLTQRQRQTVAGSATQQPIVYAPPAPPVPPVNSTADRPTARPQPPGKPAVIQAKFIASSPSTLSSPHSSAELSTPSSTALSSSAPPQSFQPPAVERSPLSAPEPVSPALPPPASTPADLPLVSPTSPPPVETDQPPLRIRRAGLQGAQEQPFSRVQDLSPVLPPFVDESIAPPVVPASPPPSPEPSPLPFEFPTRPVVARATVQSKDNPPLPLVVVSRGGSDRSSEPASSAHPPLVRPKPRSSAGSEPDLAPTQATTAPPLPLVQVSSRTEPRGVSPEQQASLFEPARPNTPPLVFSVPPSSNATSHGQFVAANRRFAGTPGNGNLARSDDRSNPAYPPPSSVPIVSPQTIQSTQNPPPQEPKIDVNDLADKVERKLIRRLMVERERRGIRG